MKENKHGLWRSFRRPPRTRTICSRPFECTRLRCGRTIADFCGAGRSSSDVRNASFTHMRLNTAAMLQSATPRMGSLRVEESS